MGISIFTFTKYITYIIKIRHTHSLNSHDLALEKHHLLVPSFLDPRSLEVTTFKASVFKSLSFVPILTAIFINNLMRLPLLFNFGHHSVLQ